MEMRPLKRVTGIRCRVFLLLVLVKPFMRRFLLDVEYFLVLLGLIFYIVGMMGYMCGEIFCSPGPGEGSARGIIPRMALKRLWKWRRDISY